MKRGEAALVVDYFMTASADFLTGMGVDQSKLPEREAWITRIDSALNQSYEEKKLYYLLWLVDQQPVGHSNINQLRYGKEAHMHLHLWRDGQRSAGLGTYFVRRSVPYYFKHFCLEKLYCTPYAMNSAPNRTLVKAGFKLKQTYETTPGPINFRQTVNQYVLTEPEFRNNYTKHL